MSIITVRCHLLVLRSHTCINFIRLLVYNNLWSLSITWTMWKNSSRWLTLDSEVGSMSCNLQGRCRGNLQFSWRDPEPTISVDVSCLVRDLLPFKWLKNTNCLVSCATITVAAAFCACFLQWLVSVVAAATAAVLLQQSLPITPKNFVSQAACNSYCFIQSM